MEHNIKFPCICSFLKEGTNYVQENGTNANQHNTAPPPPFFPTQVL